MRLSSILCDTFVKNLPKKYVERSKGVLPKRVYERRFGAPVLRDYGMKPDEFVPGKHRTWEFDGKINLRQQLLDDTTSSYKQRKRWSRYDDVNFPIYRGDVVQILVGKDKGKHGVVRFVIRERNWVFVGGFNIKYEWQDGHKSLGYPGSYNAIEQPLEVPFEVALVDPVSMKPTEVDIHHDAGGNIVRISRESNKNIKIPATAQSTYEYKTMDTYQESDKDTSAAKVRVKTYKPVLGLFEEEIMEEMGIEDDREFAKSYWY